MLFGLDESDYADATRVIIVAVGELEVGLIVDAANDVIDIPVNAIEPPPEVVGGVEAAYLRGVAKLDKRLLILLNLDKVLSTEEIKQLDAIEG
jgi:purine-binding chemotaxis protein CheW